MLVGAVTTVSAQAPAAQAPMNMAEHGSAWRIRGTVRGATGPAAETTAVTAVDAATGARFEAMTDAQGA